TLLITHDVDEALYMSDRVCMMTSGPHARVGKLLSLPFERPRHRASVLEHAEYYDLRGELVSFLEDQDHRRPVRQASQPSEPAWDDTMHMVRAWDETMLEEELHGAALSGEGQLIK